MQASLLTPATEHEHAFMSPSNYHWLKYDGAKLIEVWDSNQNKALGTRLHILAQELITMRIKVDPSRHPTVALFVNDAIDLGMYSEVHLEYSDLCYGTADVLLFAHNILHIWDLKTGKNRVHHSQLFIYAALFCLQNNIDPYTIIFDLRIYQHGKHVPAITYPEEIANTMTIIVEDDRIIREHRAIQKF